MRIGIIYVAHQMAEYVPMSLGPWIAARTQHLDDHEFVIAAVSVPFAGFPQDKELDGTVGLLKNHLDANEIDHLITGNEPMVETQARGAALTYLKSQDVDIVWQVDSDESYTEQNIYRIARFVDKEPYIPSFRLCLKNYVFDDKTYLVDPFTPMRIHRIKVGSLEAMTFWADNNVMYGMPGLSYNRRDDELAVMTVPQGAAWIRHITWLSDLRSKRKIEYHENHFTSRPTGVRSSYRWDEDKGLVFNEAYYAYVGQQPPKVLRD